MTTGKTIGLTRRTFVGKVMSLLLYMLSRLVIKNYNFFKKLKCGDFAGRPVVKTSPFRAGRVGLIPGQGARIPQAS